MDKFQDFADAQIQDLDQVQGGYVIIEDHVIM